MPASIPVDENGNPLSTPDQNFPGITVSARLAQLATPPQRRSIRVDENGQPLVSAENETVMPNWFNQYVTSRFPSLATTPSGRAIRVDESGQPLATTATLQNWLTQLYRGIGR
jgi:hypothetical protein